MVGGWLREDFEALQWSMADTDNIEKRYQNKDG